MWLIEKIDCYKKAIDELHPFEGHLLNEIKGYYRIVLTWSSNAIEGNARWRLVRLLHIPFPKLS